ncbi:MAG: hypothetical protein ACD_86C00003G0022 [uncultured bacterium]|nr:MAG: hypothetical protein ACD_86C00003G0022 [uncultured bacterium]
MNDTTLVGSSSADMEALLNQTLDGVKAAPDFTTPPAGEYRLSVKDAKLIAPKEAGKSPRINVMYTVVQTYATASGEAPVPDESMFSEGFQFTDTGLPYFKSRVAAILNVDNVDGVTIGDMLSSLKGQSFDARISIKKSPNPKGGEYENIQIRVVPPAA